MKMILLFDFLINLSYFLIFFILLIIFIRFFNYSFFKINYMN